VTGGIVVLDDYGFYSCGGVTKLVNTMTGLSDRLVIYNINGHAIIVKRGEIGTHTPQPSHGIAV
jgi:O-methyltransferase